MPKLREPKAKTPRVVLSPEELRRRRDASQRRYREARAELRDQTLRRILVREITNRGGYATANELLLIPGLLSYAQRASAAGRFLMVATKDNGVIYSLPQSMDRLA
jgi:hypothetical protein